MGMGVQDKFLDFASWWIGELKSLIPAGLAERLSAGKSLKLSTGDAVNAGDNVVLQLNGQEIFDRVLQLPPGCSDQLGSIVPLQIVGKAPAALDKLVWGYDVLVADAQATIVRVVMARRDRVVEWEARYRDGGAVVRGVEADGVEIRVPELARQNVKRGLRQLAPGAASFAMLVAALGFLESRTAGRSDEVAMSIDLVRAEAAPILEARQAQASMQQMQAFLSVESGSPRQVFVLDILTELLPDDSWVSQYGFNAGQITISGEASDSAGLAGKLAGADIFSSARLQNVGPSGDRERFEIVLELAR